MDTPSQTLATKIAERLAKEGLITSARAKHLTSKLADGKQSQEDWRLLIELSQKEVEAKP
jgi:hypothetical protein